MKRNIIYMVGALLSSAILTLSCSEDNIPSYSELTVDKNDLFIKIEKPIDEVNITEGNGNYKITVADENIATAKVEGNRIVFTALKNGRTTVTVTDWAKHSTIINVRVKEDFDLALDKEKLTLIKGVNPTGLVYISSGNGEYQIKSSNEEIATATLTEDGKVEVAFVSGGFADITITDADGKNAVVKVAACEYELTLDAIPVAWKVSTDNIININSGNGEYQITSADESIATAELITNVKSAGKYAIKITGVAKGETNITLTDKMGLSTPVAVKVRNDLAIETNSIDNIVIGTPQEIIISNDCGSGDYSWEISGGTMTCKMSEDKTKLIVDGAKGALNQTITLIDKTFGTRIPISVKWIDYPFETAKARWFIQNAFGEPGSSSLEKSNDVTTIKVGEWYKPIFGNGYIRNGFSISFKGGNTTIGEKTEGRLYTVKNDGKNGTEIKISNVRLEKIKFDENRGEDGLYWIKFREDGKDYDSYIVAWT